MLKASTAATSGDRAADVSVDVWIVDLDNIADSAGRLMRCLSPAEMERCDRFVDAEGRRRWVTARAALRHVLGAALGVDAATLVMLQGERGKPHLEGARGIEFSLSHSRGLALIAVAATAVGVDVEHDRVIHRLHRTARRLLHEDTMDRLLQLEPEQRPGAFLDAWTLREAHVKAVGGGLFHTPDTLPYDPAVAADGRPVLVHERDTGHAWSLARLRPGPGAHAAVVASGAVNSVHVHDATDTRQLLEESA